MRFMGVDLVNEKTNKLYIDVCGMHHHLPIGLQKIRRWSRLSLSSKKSRVAATWQFKKVTYSSADITSEFLDVTWEMKKDGP